MDGGASIYVMYTAMAASAAIGAYSAYQSGQAQKEASQYQSAVARNNAILAGEYAKVELVKGQRLEEAKRMETANRQGAIRAAAAAGGIDVDSGSPLRLQEDTALLGEFDAQTVRYNAQRAAHGYRVQGMNYSAQAELDGMAAENASRQGTLGAWSSIIGGASQISSKWKGWQSNPGGG